MNHRLTLLVVLLCASFGAGCPTPSSPNGEREVGTGDVADATSDVDSPGLVSLETQVIEFVPSRADFSIGKAVFNLHCAEPERVELNGSTPRRWTLIELERVGANRFRLPRIDLTARTDPPGLVCFSIKVWFNEVGNMYDSPFYANVDDRYALVAFATRTAGPAWERARPRFSQNRVETIERFKRVIAKPIPIRLNDRPLSDVANWRARDEAAGRGR